MSTPLLTCLIIWAIITAVYVALTIYRSLVGLHEDDQLFLTSGATAMEMEQRELQKKLSRLAPFTKTLGFLSLVLLLASAGIWVYDTLKGSGMML
jgi:hypothetical protein